ncbi:hypothetical protein LTR17_013768 [Elasticomyces elasticus]|nr:hypothetical protein LTR17_013768 [Elasticomyces elasticus]
MHVFSALTALAASALISSAHASDGPTFTKTVGYSYSTHHNPQPTCGGTIYHSSAAHCPTGCKLDRLTYGAAKPVYECRPAAVEDAVAAWPIVAHLSCHTANHDFTTTITPAYGKHWTTCASRTAGRTEYAPAATLAVTTKAP